MGHPKTLSLFLIAAALVSLSAAAISRAAEPRCVQTRRAVEEKKHLVSEYMRALQKAYDRRELQIAELLNFKISKLKAQIKELERNLTGCPGNSAEGIEGTKSDQGLYSDKNCQELRKILFSLVRKIHALDKRKKSLLSNLSEEEELKLQDATEERVAVETVLSIRCSERRDRRGLLKRLRR